MFGSVCLVLHWFWNFGKIEIFVAPLSSPRKKGKRITKLTIADSGSFGIVERVHHGRSLWLCVQWIQLEIRVELIFQLGLFDCPQKDKN
jgi:hypothetical protein